MVADKHGMGCHGLTQSVRVDLKVLSLCTACWIDGWVGLSVGG